MDSMWACPFGLWTSCTAGGAWLEEFSLSRARSVIHQLPAAEVNGYLSSAGENA